MTDDVSTNPHLYALIAGEVSGDTLGAGLMKAILRRDPDAKFIGIGGPKMIKCGMVSAFNMEELSVMGIFEVVAHASTILRIRSQITKMLLKARPCIMIGIDSPDFNLSVERKLKEAGIKTVHYVSPSVWAWREKRIVKIKASTDEVLALLPFEKEFYDRHEMPCTYVGHTLANSIPLDIDERLARERCGLFKNAVEDIEGKVLAILPGSRRGVIKRMLPIYARTAKILKEKIDDVSFISVAPNKEIAILIKDVWLEHAPQISLTVFVGNSQDVIASADCCLLTCGTIAFEAMLLKRPMVVAYKVSWLSAQIARRLLKVSMYSLPNLLAKREIVKEMIQEDCTPMKLAHECIKLLTSDNLLMKKEFAAIHSSIITNADELASDAVFRLLGNPEYSIINKAKLVYSPEDEILRLSKNNVSPSLLANLSAQKALAAPKKDEASSSVEAKTEESTEDANDKSDTIGENGVAVKTRKRGKKKKNGVSGDQSVADNDEVSANESDSTSDSGTASASEADSSTSSKVEVEGLNSADYTDDGSKKSSQAQEEVPLAHGLTDDDVARLKKEVKQERPKLSLDAVLHMPNMEASKKKLVGGFKKMIKRI